MPINKQFKVEYCRGLDYEQAMEKQLVAIKRLKQERSSRGLLLLVEHRPLITLGRSGSKDNLLVDFEALQDAGISYQEVRRGGDITYHGPGQITLYPVFPLEWWERDLHLYLRRLEEVGLLFLQQHNLQGERRKKLTGVWLGKKKIAAIGIAVSHWISYFGMAVNLNPELNHFSFIRPCGLEKDSVTSLTAITGRQYLIKREMRRLVACFLEAFPGAGISEDRPGKLPDWLHSRVPGETASPVRKILQELRLNTVCASAHCPNSPKCYARGRATFLLLGTNCTRSCKFCAVEKRTPRPPLPDEPGRVAEAVAQLNLRHAVITSVTRDDLADGGAGYFVATIKAIRKLSPATTIEILTPDFQGNRDSIRACALAKPDIFNHNLETIERLYPGVRPQANYRQSLDLLRLIKYEFPEIITKSGIMLGFGESREEVMQACRDLYEAGCQVLTLGQYLAPSPAHFQVVEYIQPEVFGQLREAALRLGFREVASAPLVRSSYKAEEVFDKLEAVDVVVSCNQKQGLGKGAVCGTVKSFMKDYEKLK